MPAGSEDFALLKIPDGLHVTEPACNNPMFVEEVARKETETALSHPGIYRFSVSVESFESIHKHSAYAYTDSDEI